MATPAGRHQSVDGRAKSQHLMRRRNRRRPRTLVLMARSGHSVVASCTWPVFSEYAIMQNNHTMSSDTRGILKQLWTNVNIYPGISRLYRVCVRYRAIGLYSRPIPGTTRNICVFILPRLEVPPEKHSMSRSNFSQTRNNINRKRLKKQANPL